MTATGERTRPALLLLALLLLSLPAPALAQAVFGASPGPLARAHKDARCEQCHRTKQDVPADRCLSCHQPVAGRIAAGKGLHGGARVRGKECRLCHGEHRGLDADLFGWAAVGGKEKFDHDATGFALTGKHKGAPCERCHKQRSPGGKSLFLGERGQGLPTACVSCHRADSRHGPVRPAFERCERCHDAASWRPLRELRFDHDRDTAYRIEGQHKGVACAACHVKARFRLPGFPGGCALAGCHKNEHGASLFGQRPCESCHALTDKWGDFKFDHERKTRFPLLGAHDTGCRECHSKEAPKAPGTGCGAAGCHKDPHQGRFAQLACASCHISRPAPAWTPARFAHDRLTRFPLTDKHALVGCRACHRGATQAEYERFPAVVTAAGVRCTSCHRHEQAHRGDPRAATPCASCHPPGKLPSDDIQLLAIGHGPDKPFQLEEGHKLRTCGSCHRGEKFTKLPINCGTGGCHKDAHQGRLGADCLRCHEGARWKATRFDHQAAPYPLRGLHSKAPCASCHPAKEPARYRPIPTACADGACHKKDDVHQGSLGARCEPCHREAGWQQVAGLFRHERAYPLTGKHAAVPCAGCHRTGHVYAPRLGAACVSCHQKDDTHRGDLGARCERCHGTDRWQAIRTGHDVSPVRFGGAHDRVPCRECHTKGRVLRGAADLCVTCHQRDDIHHNALGSRCGDCHTQQTFVGARFNHDTVGCTLRGVHRVLPCVDCHKGGNYAGLSPACVSCHRDDALRAPENRATHFVATACAGCHTVNSFRQQSGPNPPESVCQ